MCQTVIYQLYVIIKCKTTKNVSSFISFNVFEIPVCEIWITLPARDHGRCVSVSKEKFFSECRLCNLWIYWQIKKKLTYYESVKCFLPKDWKTYNAIDNSNNFSHLDFDFKRTHLTSFYRCLTRDILCGGTRHISIPRFRGSGLLLIVRG